MIRRIAVVAASAFIAVSAVAVALPASGTPVRPLSSHGHCVKPILLKHPETLTEWFRQTGVDPAIELSVAARCWHHHGGWTAALANLLDGKYGWNLRKAKLPAGTRLWDQL